MSRNSKVFWMVVALIGSSSSFGAFHVRKISLKPAPVEVTMKDSDLDLDPFEKYALGLRRKGVEAENKLKKNIQQRDLDCSESPGCAEEIYPNASPREYEQAVKDPYYGYKVFILVDKTIGQEGTRRAVRGATQRQAQTMHVFVREGNKILFMGAYPVSTGRETGPGSMDTREGYMRVQSAQQQYVSAKFGESMPYSLWFESEYGTAIHETLQSRCDSRIGMRASAGCIRLCPNAAGTVFQTVINHGYTESSYRFNRKIGVQPIVLLHKRIGLPVLKGQINYSSEFAAQTTAIGTNGYVIEPPKVIRGFPAFVRVINTKDYRAQDIPEKVQEVEMLLRNPTEGWRMYFRPVSPAVLKQVIPSA